MIQGQEEFGNGWSQNTVPIVSTQVAIKASYSTVLQSVSQSVSQLITVS